MNKKIVAGVIAVIIGVGLFYGGLKVGQAKAKTTMQNGYAQFQNGQMNSRFGMNGRTASTTQNYARGGVSGQIVSKDNTSISVKLSNGGSRIVFLSASTTVSKMAQSSVADLTTGESVIVQGQTNADGSVSGQSVQIVNR